MQVRLVDNFAELASLKEDWQRLLGASRGNSVFHTWEWTETWWAVFGVRLQLQVLIAEADSNVVGIAPLSLGTLKMGGISLRALQFLGQQGETTTEYHDILCKAEDEDAVCSAFANFIKQQMAWDVFTGERMLDDSAACRWLLPHFTGDGYTIEQFKHEQPAYLPLGESLESMLAAKSRNFRQQYRQSVRRLEKLGETKLLVAGKDMGVSEALAIVAQLNRERWQERGSSFKTDAYFAFHEKLAARFAENGWLWLAILTLDGEPVAARYDFCYGGKMWCFQGGWHPKIKDCRPGTIMTGYAIEHATASSLKEYDFLCGEADYKTRWSEGTRSSHNWEVFNKKTLRGKALPILRAIKRKLSG